MSSGSSKKSGSSSKDKSKDSAKKAASDAKELRKQLEKKAEKLAAKAADDAKKAEKKAQKRAAEKADEARKAAKKADKKAQKKAQKSSGAGGKKSGKKSSDSGRSAGGAEVLLSPATETALITPINIGRDVTPKSKSDLPSTVPVIVEAELSPATAPQVRAAAEAAMKPSEAWTVVALRARARQLGLVGYSSLTKSQLLERLRD